MLAARGPEIARVGHVERAAIRQLHQLLHAGAAERVLADQRRRACCRQRRGEQFGGARRAVGREQHDRRGDLAVAGVGLTASPCRPCVSRVDSVLPAGTNGRAAAMPSSRSPSAVSRRSTMHVAWRRPWRAASPPASSRPAAPWREGRDAHVADARRLHLGSRRWPAAPRGRAAMSRGSVALPRSTVIVTLDPTAPRSSRMPSRADRLRVGAPLMART